MLDALDQVDWDRLTDAYGPASAVPEQLRRLRAEDAEVRRQAYQHLQATIVHQGSRYRASAPAVPFLFELIEEPSTPERDRLIDLLLQLAVGYPEQHLPLGIDRDREFRAVQRLERRRSLERIRAAEPDEDEDLDPGIAALWARDAYEAVERRLPTLRRLARDNQIKVRISAGRALAFFPRGAGDSIPLVRAAAATAGDPSEAAGALLALGLLLRSAGARETAPFEPRLAASQHPEVRLAAAISLGVLLNQELPPPALEVLIEAIGSGVPGEAPLAGWTYAGPVSYAAQTVATIRPRLREPLFSTLCEAAAADDTWSRASIWLALLYVAFRRRRPLRWVPDSSLASGCRAVYLDPERLTRNQKRALLAIGANPVWVRQPSLADHHMDVLMSFSLPWLRDRFQELTRALS